MYKHHITYGSIQHSLGQSSVISLIRK